MCVCLGVWAVAAVLFGRSGYYLYTKQPPTTSTPHISHRITSHHKHTPTLSLCWLRRRHRRHREHKWRRLLCFRCMTTLPPPRFRVCMFLHSLLRVVDRHGWVPLCLIAHICAHMRKNFCEIVTLASEREQVRCLPKHTAAGRTHECATFVHILFIWCQPASE